MNSTEKLPFKLYSHGSREKSKWLNEIKILRGITEVNYRMQTIVSNNTDGMRQNKVIIHKNTCLSKASSVMLNEVNRGYPRIAPQKPKLKKWEEAGTNQDRWGTYL